MSAITSVKNIFDYFLKYKNDRKQISKVVLPSFFIHFIAAILALVLMTVMTRTLGAANYGLFTFSFSIIFVIANLTTYGVNILTVREVSALLASGNIELLKGFYKWSSRLILLICIATPLLAALLIAALVYYLQIVKETSYTLPILFALTAIPFYALSNYYICAIRGQNKPVLSLLTDNIVKPLTFLISFVCVYFTLKEMTVRNAILLNSLSFAVGFLFTFFLYQKTGTKPDATPAYDLKKWNSSLRSLLLLTVVFSLSSRVDILMLGLIRNSSDVGIFSPADRVAEALTVFLTIMNVISSATISKLHSLNEKQKLQDMLTKISRGVMLLSLPAYAFIVIFSKQILHFFGPNFSEGQIALIIICTAQLISIAFGPLGNYAVMTGNEKYTIRFASIKILLNVALNLLLTPKLGINGTAIASAIGIIFWNAGMFITIKKKTGISTWIFG
jgi:O-antigen/teichoic acid export membrane protein